MNPPEFSAEHLGLPARDPVALKDWYVGALGARLVFDSGQTPPAFFVELPGGLLVEIYQGATALPQTGDNSVAGWRHLALRVAALERARDELAARGVVFEGPIRPAGGGGRVLFFRDREGNLLHLVERPKGAAAFTRGLKA
ncbi:MAG: VOC family protein [Verrucomicrobia bacterium]|nr:VOC family protein [Verrucomicrobiota bacterium]